jgi:hypothetical protein
MNCSHQKTESTTKGQEIVREQPRIVSPEPVPEDALNDNCSIFDNFSNIWVNNWTSVNDWVMWWRSQGTYTIDNQTMIFSWNINTNGWWFASIRSNKIPQDMSDITSIKIRAKPDNRKYTLTFRDNNSWRISHQADLVFQNTGWYEEIDIDISNLQATFFWRIVGQSNQFNKKQVREIGFILSDWVDGPFKINIDRIKLCR